MSRDRYQQLGPTAYARQQRRGQTAASAVVDAELRREAEERRREQRERAEAAADAVTERRRLAHQAAIDLSHARVAHEEAKASLDDAIVARRINAVATTADEAEAWADLERARRELHAREVVVDYLRGPGL